MRTTIELSDTLRAQLLELAARRGERGFSTLVEEAVTRYLGDEQRRAKLSEDARQVLGTLPEEDAQGIEASVRALREHWR